MTQAAKAQNVHLLVVEDDSNDVLFLKRALDRLGIHCPVSFAVNGAEAIDLFSSSLQASRRKDETALPTHVLLDLKLPLKSGIEVLEWLRSHPVLKEIPVVILTSSAEPSDVDRATRLGIDSYRVKPAGIDSYLRIVDQIASAWKLI